MLQLTTFLYTNYDKLDTPVGDQILKELHQMHYVFLVKTSECMAEVRVGISSSDSKHRPAVAKINNMMGQLVALSPTCVSWDQPVPQSTIHSYSTHVPRTVLEVLVSNIQPMDTQKATMLNLDVKEAFRAPLLPQGGTLTVTSLKDIGNYMAHPVGAPVWKVLACVQHVTQPQTITTKYGMSTKRSVRLEDEYGNTTTLELWNDMCSVGDEWKPKNTVLLLTNAVVRTYRGWYSLAMGHTTWLEVDPRCKEAMWLQRMAATLNVPSSQIQATPDTMWYIYVMVSELDIVNNVASRGIVLARCPCGHSNTVVYLECRCVQCDRLLCSSANSSAKEKARLTYRLEPVWAVVDHTAEVRHPFIQHQAVVQLLGYQPEDYLALNPKDKYLLKVK
ncbi:hypothetical protein IWQ62_002525 [Dispira parvispora]|uniref:Uncharacterized protein n=1 Tax=Dispira parvispora TaxID=1520584 RepID=A0A9W8AWJ2_9FUNG|nr:hypothetical protein IWQ62_002525 [Dispira parvispora]